MEKVFSNIEYVLIDLDGTLLNTREGIVNCLTDAFNAYGIKNISEAQFDSFIGPPLVDSIMSVGLCRSDAEDALAIYRKRYSEKGIYECKLYPHVAQTLRELAKSKKLVLATSKPQIFADKMLKMFEVADCFALTVGSSLDSSLNEKKDIIAYALRLCKCDLKAAVMVGDRKFDILGARDNGIKSIGVLYGFGEKKELEDAGANCLIEDFADLLSVL